MTLPSARFSSAITRPSMPSPGTTVASFRIQSPASSHAVRGGTPSSSAIGIGSTAKRSMMPPTDVR